MRRPTPTRTFLAIVIVLACLGTVAGAATVEDPVYVDSSSAQNPTLGIPRWKGWIDPSNPLRMWATFANSSTRANNVAVSEDAGETWSGADLNPSGSGYLDYHVAVSGRGGDVYFVFPGNDGVTFRRLRAPARTSSDWLPPVVMPQTTPFHRASIMTDGAGRIWVFTRRGDVPSENVRYHWSDDQGTTWQHGTAVATATPDVRVGSMPWSDGRACLVVLHLNSDRGYRYYLWDGNAFTPPPDSVIRAGDVGYARAFTHHMLGTGFHLVYGLGGELRHRWKDTAGGQGAWQEEVLDSQPAMDPMEWSPILTVRGDEMFLFYSRWSSGPADSQIFVRRRNPQSGAWEPPVPVSGGGLTYNRHPNTAHTVPAGSDHIPVFWTSGPAGDAIHFNRLTGSSVPVLDDVPPARVRDLMALGRPGSGSVELQWTAPDDALGAAAAYELRHARTPVTAASWADAVPVADPPLPAAPGTVQRLTVDGLTPGATYHFALRARDAHGNLAEISNVAWVKVGSGESSQVPDGAARVVGNHPNPFNPQTTVAFALPHDGFVRLTVHDAAGRRVAELLGAWRPAGTHEVRWDGRDTRGRAVASGTYFSRLVFDGRTATGAMTLVR